MSQKGRMMMVIRGYTFCKKQEYFHGKVRWRGRTLIKVGGFTFCKRQEYSTVLGQFQYTIKKSLRGNPIISIDGYRFSRRYANQNRAKVRWRCSTHHSLRCRAVLFTVKGEVVFVNNNHNHTPIDNYNVLPFVDGQSEVKSRRFLLPTSAITSARQSEETMALRHTQLARMQSTRADIREYCYIYQK
ncbi:hypothetical protein KGM_208259 [Danaus plexippus plexippus]|uniref:FLYWCH-type domain-containing protein n=1 Tax=Danaus plexippus plexippus TaxID=278856 RepID=A0A212EXQ3_DANPL|nr:hypothetical protein KGM_208259 [Danaus plexippus plexippus]